ncbi:LppA family lipoprotein [Cellulomonas aerilata]|uniref:LppA family lipoprotein n=1 Tax=Cellulomonas aerilata TaxID=515326 RepID=UPI0011BF5846|nr:LppA family lipoprotein [Cellulomonas aerilata]
MGGETGQQRPSIEVVEVEYTAMMERVQDALTTEYGVGPWSQHGREPVTGFLCDEVEGGSGIALNLGSAGPISDQDWPAALKAVQDIVGEHGFTELDTVIDEPGDHLVRLAKSDGGYVDFGTQLATALSLLTGCHPTESSSAPAS